jgi:hypothetical protein
MPQWVPRIDPLNSDLHVERLFLEGTSSTISESWPNPLIPSMFAKCCTTLGRVPFVP